MTRFHKNFLIVSGICALIIVASILVFFVFFADKDMEIEVKNDYSQDEIVDMQEDFLPEENEVKEIIQPQEETPKAETIATDDVYAKQVSRIFVERFQTYSNQNNNSHIEDVLPLLTSSMAKWAQNQGLEQSTDYKGVVTKVISSQIDSIDEDKAVVLVDIQQTITQVGSQKVEYKSGRVNLVKFDNTWKVNGFYWE